MLGPTTAGLTKHGRRPITSDAADDLIEFWATFFCATVVYSLLFPFLLTPMYLGVSCIS